MQATFPYLAGWRSVRFWPEGMSLEPQQSITGVDTMVPTMRGRWMAQGTVVIHGEAAVLQWQAFLAEMEGRVGTTLVPCFSWFRPKDRNGRMLPFNDTAGFHRTQTFSHFGLTSVAAPRVTVAAAAPLRATELRIALADTTGLRPGQYFSIGERLHQVRSHWEPEVGQHHIRFRPPLREAVAAGTAVEIARPVCKMRFTSEEEGGFAQDYADIAPKITVNFTEAL